MSDENIKKGSSMRRKIERILALLGTAVCIADAASFWKYLPGPGTPYWPFTDYPLVEITILGLIGAVGVALDNGQRSNNIWGALPWVVTGCLAPYVILGAASFGPPLMFAGLLYIGAGVLASQRCKRSLLPGINSFSLGAVGNLVIILVLIKATGGI